MGVGHEAGNLIMETMVMSKSTKNEAMAKPEGEEEDKKKKKKEKREMMK